MNWEALGAIAELTGAVAVIVTLAFLTVQIRQSAAATRAATTQSVLSAAASFLEGIVSSEQLADIFMRGLRDRSSLTEPERFRFDLQMNACLRRWEAVHRQGRNGALPDADWEGLRGAMARVMSFPGARSWWQESPPPLNADFREFIDKLGAA